MYMYMYIYMHNGLVHGMFHQIAFAIVGFEIVVFIFCICVAALASTASVRG